MLEIRTGSSDSLDTSTKFQSPITYDEAYDKTMESISSQSHFELERAKKILAWVSLTPKPLSLGQLRHAISIEPDAVSFDRENKPSASVIVNICRGLIVVNSEAVSLIHYTAKEYFATSSHRWFPDAHDLIARALTTDILYEMPKYTSNQSISQQLSIGRQGDWGYYHMTSQPKDKSPIAQYSLDHLHFHAARANVDLQARVTKMIEDPVFMKYLIVTILLRGSPYKITQEIIKNKGVPDSNDELRGEICNLFFNQEIGETATTKTAGWKEMHLAAYLQLSICVPQLLNHGHHVDCVTDLGQTPLMFACHRGYNDIALTLLQFGANPDLRDSYGRNSLTIAVMKQNYTLVNILLTHQPAPSMEHCLDNALHKLLHGVLGYSEEVSDLMRTCSVLFDHGADPNQLHRGDLPIAIAIRNANAKAVGVLLKAKTILDVHDDRLEKSLCYIVTKSLDGCFQVFKAVKKARPLEYTEIMTVLGSNLLITALRHGKGDKAKFLLQEGAPPIGRRDFMNGQDVLKTVLSTFHRSSAEFWIDQALDVNWVSDSGRNAAFFAAASGRLGILKILVHRGCDPLAPDNEGQIVLHTACRTRFSHPDMVEFLLNQGAHCDASDHYGRTPLFYASAAGHRDIVAKLIEKGGDPNILDNVGQSPLFWAARQGSLSIVELLIRNWGNPRIVDTSGRTALVEAVIHCRFAIIRFIMGLIGYQQNYEMILRIALFRISTSSLNELQGFSPDCDEFTKLRPLNGASVAIDLAFFIYRLGNVKWALRVAESIARQHNRRIAKNRRSPLDEEDHGAGQEIQIDAASLQIVCHNSGSMDGTLGTDERNLDKEHSAEGFSTS